MCPHPSGSRPSPRSFLGAWELMTLAATSRDAFSCSHRVCHAHQLSQSPQNAEGADRRAVWSSYARDPPGNPLSDSPACEVALDPEKRSTATVLLPTRKAEIPYGTATAWRSTPHWQECPRQPLHRRRRSSYLCRRHSGLRARWRPPSSKNRASDEWWSWIGHGLPQQWPHRTTS